MDAALTLLRKYRAAPKLQQDISEALEVRAYLRAQSQATVCRPTARVWRGGRHLLAFVGRWAPYAHSCLPATQSTRRLLTLI